MSDISGQGLQDAGTADQATTDANASQGTDQGLQQQQQQQQFDHPFLQQVPEEHRSILAPYVQRWDANVTRRMMEQARQFEPYKNLGDIEEAQRAVQFLNAFRQNPQEIYNRLKQAFEQQQQQQAPLQPNGFQNGQGQGQYQYPEDVAPFFQQFDQRFGQFDQRFNQFQQSTTQILEALANHVMTQQQTAQEATEDAALDRYISAAKVEFGEFDERYVLTQMYAGMSIEEAVQDWKSRVQQGVNQTRAPSAGPTLSGSGGAPPQGQQVTDLSRQQTKALVASVLEQAAKAGG
jgi:hypothetical protein